MRDKTWRGWRKPGKRQWYPQWGADARGTGNDVYRFFRYGEPGFMTMYLVPPSDYLDRYRAEQGKPLLGDIAYKLLKPGIAVEDVALSIVIVAALAVGAYAVFGPAMDNCLDVLGV